MEKIYTFKEANNLIKEYSTLLNRLLSSKDYVQKYKSNLYNDVLKTEKKSFFKNYLIKDIKSDIVSDWNYDDINVILKDMYCYFKSQALTIKCEKLYNDYNGEILSNISQLKNGKNVFKWFFSSSKDKENAEKSYRYLMEMMKSEFYMEAKEAVGTFFRLDESDLNEIYNHVEKDKYKYRNVLFKLFPQITKIGSKVEVINNLCIEYGNIINKRNKVLEDIECKKNEIKKQLEVLISIETMKMIKEIPIEELNRGKGGIRVKSLRDYGYKNIGDVYISNPNQIASVQGISYSGAVNIKNIAAGIARDAANNVKIKLNVDNQDTVSTNVVRLVNQYIYKNNCMQKIENLINEYKTELEKNKNNLLEVLNGIKYYFSSSEDKRNYIDSYKNMKDVLHGEKFGGTISTLFKSYFITRNVSINEAWNDFKENSISYYNVIEGIYPGLLGNADLYYGLPQELAQKIQEEVIFPEGLVCTLRKYQEMGVKYILHQKKVLLGDEMGLGKTVQAIATMVSLRNTGATHFMVVCPASVVTNWCREISRHSKLRATMIHGRNRGSALCSWIRDGGVAVTTYEGTSAIYLNDNFKYSLLVVDEAHYIKNPKAQRSINTERLEKHAERVLFMTGTALENRVDEMINLIRILEPSIAQKTKNIAFLSSAPKFREMIAPVYYRRKRDDVLTELPELIETKEWCEMGKEEENKYEESVMFGSFQDVRRLSWDVDDLKNSSKANRLKELIEEAKDDDRKIIVFSYFLNTIQKISEFLGDICTCPITGAISSERRQEIIDEFDKAPAGKVLLSQIIAGGTGLNIQSASVVIICEPQFKPSTENQAISRAYRMGQARNVLVYRLLCENTIDEKITNLLEKKQKIFDEFADKSVAAEREAEIEVDETAFGEIIKEEIERIKEKDKYKNNS